MPPINDDLILKLLVIAGLIFAPWFGHAAIAETRSANEKDIESDLHALLQEDEGVAVLCLFRCREGITTYAVKERWIKTDDPQHLKNTLEAVGMSYRTCVANGTFPNPMPCVIIASRKRFQIVPVRSGMVCLRAADSKANNLISLQEYKRLVEKAAAPADK